MAVFVQEFWQLKRECHSYDWKNHQIPRTANLISNSLSEFQKWSSEWYTLCFSTCLDVANTSFPYSCQHLLEHIPCLLINGSTGLHSPAVSKVALVFFMAD